MIINEVFYRFSGSGLTSYTLHLLHEIYPQNSDILIVFVRIVDNNRVPTLHKVLVQVFCVALLTESSRQLSEVSTLLPLFLIRGN